MGGADNPMGPLHQKVARQSVRGLVQTRIIRPERVAGVMLCAGQMKRIRCSKAEALAQLRAGEEYRFGQWQCDELRERALVVPLQDEITARKRLDQTLQFDQR